MMGSQDDFTNMTMEPRYIHVELGDNSKYVVEGTGSMEFQMDTCGIMEMSEVLYIV